MIFCEFAVNLTCLRWESEWLTVINDLRCSIKGPYKIKSYISPDDLTISVVYF